MPEVRQRRLRQKLKPIVGYPESGASSWRASNDAAFIEAANKFNHHHGLAPGDPMYIDPAFVKAWAMVESGGSKSAFLRDPLQVNNPADWADEKLRVMGISRRQIMTPATSADAALRWLYYKSFIRDTNGRPGPWIGFERALQRYNGRNKLHSSGVPHKVWYAREVMRLYKQAKSQN
jgi:hypothetical protein